LAKINLDKEAAIVRVKDAEERATQAEQKRQARPAQVKVNAAADAKAVEGGDGEQSESFQRR
jgi:hypothetical protein